MAAVPCGSTTFARLRRMSKVDVHAFPRLADAPVEQIVKTPSSDASVVRIAPAVRPVGERDPLLRTLSDQVDESVSHGVHPDGHIGMDVFPEDTATQVDQGHPDLGLHQDTVVVDHVYHDAMQASRVVARQIEPSDRTERPAQAEQHMTPFAQRNEARETDCEMHRLRVVQFLVDVIPGPAIGSDGETSIPRPLKTPVQQADRRPAAEVVQPDHDGSGS